MSSAKTQDHERDNAEKGSLFLSKNLCRHVYVLIFYFLLSKHSVHKIFCNKIRITVSKPGEVFCREFIILLIRWYFCSQPINIAIDETKHGSH